MRDSGIEVLWQGRNFLRLLEGLWTSVSIALLALAISIFFGLFVGVTMTSKRRLLRFLTRAYLEFIRFIPQLVLLFVVYFNLAVHTGVNLGGFTTVVIVFSVWGSAEMGDLVRSAVQSIPARQYASGFALGMTKAQVNLNVILPQTIRRLLPLTINLANRMIMTTPLVVPIGVTEVLKAGQQIIDANRFAYPRAALWVYGAIFLLYFAVCYVISQFPKYLERRWNK